MRTNSEQSRNLYHLLQNRGYPENFCKAITDNLNTDFTASKMIGYLKHNPSPSVTEVVDEMLSILDLREQIIKKKEMEHTQASINEMMRRGF